MNITNNHIQSSPVNIFDICSSGENMECPKCGSLSARITEDHSAYILRCLCGLNQVLQSKYADGSVIDHIDFDENLTLPKKGTKLMNAFGALFAIEPATTGDVADLVNINAVEKQSNSDVASQLTILRYKGLCDIIEYKRGILGGSVWKVTDKAKKLVSR